MKYQLPHHLTNTKEAQEETEKILNRFAHYLKKGVITGIIILLLIVILNKII